MSSFFRRKAKGIILFLIRQCCKLRCLYPNTGKIALCCIGKMENDYIRFFVEYYQRLHFDKIFIYDNNDQDGESFEDVIGDYIESGLVEVTNFRGRKIAQLAAYQDCYDKHKKEYDWIAFFDCDEFLTFANGTDDIHTFLSRDEFKHFQVIHINWKVYGDSNMLDTDGRNIVDRLTQPIPDDTLMWCGNQDNQFENDYVKSLVRGGCYITWKMDSHSPRSNYYWCCNALGQKTNLNSSIESFNHDVVYLRHYSTKTIGEWVRNKMARGFPDQSEESWKRILDIDFFFRYNTKTEDKVAYAEKVLREMQSNQS